MLRTASLLSLLVLSSAAARADNGDIKVTGEVVDITCYVSGEQRGEKHAACGRKCLTAGLPAGLYFDSKLWLLVMRDHSSPSTKLASFAGKNVTVTGKKHERDGAQIFEIATILVEPPKK